MILFTMWKNTRMIVLVAVTAALYAAILIPFKPFTIIPGITEIRPAAAIPIICSTLFGPPAAWGAAIGNLVGDIFGGSLTPGSTVGFVGNFLYGLMPFLVWRALVRRDDGKMGGMKIVAYVIGCLAASAVCAVVIGIGVGLLKIAPTQIVLPAIFLNNSVAGLTLGAVLLLALYPVVRALGMTYDQLTVADCADERDLDDVEA